MLGSDLEFPPSIGFLIENPTFLPQYTGAENLQMLSSLHQMMPTAQIESVLQRVGLHDTKYKKYSLGMKQRLGIAAAVFEQPDILLLDDICVKAKNKRITLASLKRNKSGIEGKTEYLLVALSDTGMTETKSEQGDMMMGMPVTHITMKGKLYVNTLEGELWLPGRTAKLELLSQEGEVLATYDGESQDGNVKFVLGGEIPSTQYRLVVER